MVGGQQQSDGETGSRTVKGRKYQVLTKTAARVLHAFTEAGGGGQSELSMKRVALGLQDCCSETASWQPACCQWRDWSWRGGKK